MSAASPSSPTIRERDQGLAETIEQELLLVRGSSFAARLPPVPRCQVVAAILSTHTRRAVQAQGDGPHSAGRAMRRATSPRPGQSRGVQASELLLRRAQVFLHRHSKEVTLVAKGVLLVAVLAVLLSAVLTPLRKGGPASAKTRPVVRTPRTQPWFNAHHSPVGAFASFTLGYKGASGGLGLEQAGPANQNVYVMLDAADGSHLDALPFYPIDSDAGDTGFFSQMGNALGDRVSSAVKAFPDKAIKRTLRTGTDTWTAGDLTFRILSPVTSVPDPSAAHASDAELRRAVVPCVLVEATVDNSAGAKPRRFVFGYQGNDAAGGGRRMDASVLAHGAAGIAHGLTTGIATDAPGAMAAQGFALRDVLGNSALENRTFGLGNHVVLVAHAPPGEVTTFRFVVAFHRSGRATSGVDTVYYYTRFFDSLEAVAQYGLDHFAELRAASLAADAIVEESGAQLSDSQKFSLAMAIRSYYGSTQLLLDVDSNKPLWVVNEGEYRMMNTFDLTVDQLFFELRMNPWTVRNVLDTFAQRYSYDDWVVFPSDGQSGGNSTAFPGGLSFTHDMGVANAFTPAGRGTYEQSGLHGLFSFMTHEQLVNWVLCATAYVHATSDGPWLDAHVQTLEKALESLQNRDHPDPAQRDGLMSLDSTKCAGGDEITTYDSLDTSLGRARGNVYLGSKTWAAYVALEHVFFTIGMEAQAAAAKGQADRAASTMTAALREAPEGHLPAVLGPGGSRSAILPAIEGLAFPTYCGAPEAVEVNGRYKDYLGALRTHLGAVLRPGVCLFPDAGWKLSSTSDNSWLSKVYMAQHVARTRLGYDGSSSASKAADDAHASWLLSPEESYWAWSDQMLAGHAIGSRYYPRGVTSILWLDETKAPGAPEL